MEIIFRILTYVHNLILLTHNFDEIAILCISLNA